MKLKYYSFSKRKNSTAQPTGGNEIDVVLKEPCSILSPVFKTFADVKAANYVYISDWGRYYFVDDISYDGPEYIMSCSIDALATYKSSIGSTSALIEYTTSSSDITLPDPRNKASVNFEEVTTGLLDLSTYGFSTAGYFILGVAGGLGGVTYYAMSALTLRDVLDYVFDTNFWQQIENQFFNYKDCIVSCKWIPYIPTGTSSHVIIAGQDIGISGTIVNRFKDITAASYSIYYYSDSLGLGTNYLDFAPYTTGMLYLPFVGVVPLDVDVVSKSRQIIIGASVDNFTGDIVYRLSNESGDYINSYQGNVSVNIPISSQTYNAMGAIGSGISTIGGVASAVGGIVAQNPGVVAGGLAGIAAGSLSMAQSLSVHTQVNGSISSALSASMGLQAKASVITRVPSETTLTAYKTNLGMPYFKNATISSLSGFVKCSGASCSMAGLSEEKDIVNNYLNNGFYYE